MIIRLLKGLVFLAALFVAFIHVVNQPKIEVIFRNSSEAAPMWLERRLRDGTVRKCGVGEFSEYRIRCQAWTMPEIVGE